MAEVFERGERGFGFGGFLAFAAAAAQLHAVVIDGALEDSVVIGAEGPLQVVVGRLGGVGLEHLLKLALRVLGVGRGRQRFDLRLEASQHEFAGSLETGVDEDRAEERFEGVGECGGPLASAVEGFAAAEEEVAAQVEAAALFGEEAAVDQSGAGLGEIALTEIGEAVVELAGEDQLENRVAEEFEPLVVLNAVTLFVSHRGVGEGELEEFGVPEPDAEPGLQGRPIGCGHGGTR